VSGREAVLRADVVRARDRREGTVRVHTDDLDEALDALDSLRDDAAALRRELDALRLSAAEAAGQARAECERLRADARRSDDECRRATLAAQVARSARGEAEGALARLRAVVAGRETARRGAVVEGRTTAPTRAILPVYVNPGCHSDDDGDCVWSECPQLRDGEPKATGRHCPRDMRGDE